MSARIIDGKAFAARLTARVSAEAAKLKREHGITPGIAVVLVGNDPASTMYVAAKGRAVQDAGLVAFDQTARHGCVHRDPLSCQPISASAPFSHMTNGPLHIGCRQPRTPAMHRVGCLLLPEQKLRAGGSAQLSTVRYNPHRCR